MKHSTVLCKLVGTAQNVDLERYNTHQSSRCSSSEVVPARHPVNRRLFGPKALEQFHRARGHVGLVLACLGSCIPVGVVSGSLLCALV